jgi:DNA mismatch endonuclease, patch repair protein
MHNRELPGSPDFYFRDARIAVFTDGDFWHGNPATARKIRTRSQFWTKKIERNKSRDLKHRTLLESAGIRVLRIWESDLKNAAKTLAFINRLKMLLAPKSK